MDQSPYPGTYFNPLQNFKGFASSRPPLLVFLVCLLIFAVTAASLAYVVNRTQLTDPGITVDWNQVLSHFSHLSVCVHNNDGKSVETTNDASSILDPTDDLSLSLNNVKSSANNDSVSLLVKLRFGKELTNFPNNTNIGGHVCKHTLGMTEMTGLDTVGVSLDITNERTLHCEKQLCHSDVVVCITFHGLTSSQETKKLKTCPASLNSNVTSANSLVFTVSECEDSPDTKKSKSPSCEGTILPMKYQNNPEWSIYLSEHERAIVNLHLLYTSYFLLVMAMTIVCYAIVRGRPKPKNNSCEWTLMET